MSEDPAFNASGPLTDFSTGDLLGFYAHGVFPMAEARDDPRVFLIQPEQRGIIPLNDFHIPARLRRTVRTEPFQVRLNSDFAAVVDACASAAPGREDTWINAPIRQLYMELHAMSHAHSIECWQGENLMGGLYGVSLGGAFFGESMFSRARDASKIALVHLVARLKRSGFALLDSQFLTSHLQQFGALEIPQADYLQRLRPVLPLNPDMDRLSAPMNGEEAVSWALGTN